MSSLKEEAQAIPDVCRVCTVSNVAMVNIFNCVNRNIADDIHFCTGIIILETDNLPKKICNACVQQLCIAYKFKLNCLRAEETFRGLYKHVKTEIKCERVDEGDAAELAVFLSEGSDSLPDVKKESEPPRRVRKKVRNDYCTRCDAKFPTLQELRAHRRKCRKKRQQECICELCGKRFAHTSSMYQHKRSHLPSKFFCAHCDYNTTNRSDLIKHIKLHTGEKNYQCKYCGKLFTVSNNLLRHVQRIHESTGDRRFPCQFCDKRFLDKDQLNRHMLTHSNKRDFECEICRARFTIRKHWKRHLKNLHNVIVPLLKSGRRKTFNNQEDMKDNIEDPNRVAVLGMGVLLEGGSQ